MEGNDLPKPVEGRRARRAGARIRHIPDEIADIFQEFVVADADLFGLPARMLDDGQIFAGVALPGLAADDYRLELGVTPREAANRAWSVLTGAWSAYRDALATRRFTTRRQTINRQTCGWTTMPRCFATDSSTP